jgi:rhamnose transport system permease protein
MINGAVVTLLKVPSIVATLGTLSIFRGVDYLIAGSHQVPLAGLPPGFTDPARDSILGIPIFVLVTLLVVVIGSVVLRSTRFGRQVYAVGSNPEAAAILGIPSRLVVFAAFSLCGLLAGVAGILWVMEFGTINGTSATGTVLSIVAAVVVGGVSTLGGIGTLAGAALGALFLGFIANALILVGLSQFWLQAIYGVVILVAISADAIILRRIQRATVESRAR